MAFINPDILEEDWDALTGWADGDTAGAISRINPAGEFELNCVSMSGDGLAKRSKDFGSIGSGNYYVEIRFKGDTWDGFGGSLSFGLAYILEGGTGNKYEFDVRIGSRSDAGVGIDIRAGDTNYVRIDATEWGNTWHTIVFFIHNGQTDCDIWIDKDPRTEGADYTDVDCAFTEGTGVDGTVRITGFGSVAGNGLYHNDYLYIGSETLATTTTTTSTTSTTTVTTTSSTTTTATTSSTTTTATSTSSTSTTATSTSSTTTTATSTSTTTSTSTSTSTSTTRTGLMTHQKPILDIRTIKPIIEIIRTKR